MNLLLLYRQSLKEAKKLSNENIKQFAIRRIREDYRSSDTKGEAIEGIELLKRYQKISSLYWTDYYTTIIKK